jgi:hypothetical protein
MIARCGLDTDRARRWLLADDGNSEIMLVRLIGCKADCRLLNLSIRGNLAQNSHTEANQIAVEVFGRGFGRCPMILWSPALSF